MLRVKLRPEPTNEKDKNAIAIDITHDKKNRRTSWLSFRSTMAARGKHFVSMSSVESMPGNDRMSNSNLNVLSTLDFN